MLVTHPKITTNHMSQGISSPPPTELTTDSTEIDVFPSKVPQFDPYFDRTFGGRMPEDYSQYQNEPSTIIWGPPPQPLVSPKADKSGH
jgi:hypothetical protein